MVEKNKTQTVSRMPPDDVDAAAALLGFKTSPDPESKVIEIKGTKPSYRAPAFAQVKRDQRVQFFNSTDGEVSIQFPHRHLFSDCQILRLPIGYYSGVLKVQPDVFVGHYPYSAYCHKGGEFAEGGSMPIIIVEPDK